MICKENLKSSLKLSFCHILYLVDWQSNYKLYLPFLDQRKQFWSAKWIDFQLENFLLSMKQWENLHTRHEYLDFVYLVEYIPL